MIAKQKILIVDDDENIAELISLYLTKEFYDTKIVYDGESALREFKIYEPNLVLLDLMLPGIDGYQVCREIRARSRRLYDQTIRFKRAGRTCQSCTKEISAVSSPAAKTHRKVCGISGAYNQPYELCCNLQR